jgi:rhodanese-related sulfurtransferase
MKKTIVLLFALVAGSARAEWKETPAQELQQRQAAGEKVLVVDVRSPEEFAAGHVPGAINVPLDHLTGGEAQLKEWKQRPVVLYCRSGRRSALAAGTLEKAGFAKLEHLSGDMQGWEGSGRPVTR